MNKKFLLILILFPMLIFSNISIDLNFLKLDKYYIYDFLHPRTNEKFYEMYILNNGNDEKRIKLEISVIDLFEDNIVNVKTEEIRIPPNSVKIIDNVDLVFGTVKVREKNVSGKYKIEDFIKAGSFKFRVSVVYDDTMVFVDENILIEEPIIMAFSPGYENSFEEIYDENPFFYFYCNKESVLKIFRTYLSDYTHDAYFASPFFTVPISNARFYQYDNYEVLKSNGAYFWLIESKISTTSGTEYVRSKPRYFLKSLQNRKEFEINEILNKYFKDEVKYDYLFRNGCKPNGNIFFNGRQISHKKMKEILDYEILREKKVFFRIKAKDE